MTVTPAASGADQIRRAIHLQQQLQTVQHRREKLDMLAETLANLRIIPKVWPEDKPAVIRAAIMRADLGAEFRLLPEVIDALSPVTALVHGTAEEPGVERRLAEAYDQMGNAAEAEKHFLAAERSLLPSRTDRVAAEDVLGKMGTFYSHLHQPREAIKRFRAAAELPGQDVVNQMISQVQILREVVKLDDDPLHEQAKLEMAAFDQLLFRARATNLNAGDAKLVENMALDADRVRTGNHL